MSSTPHMPQVKNKQRRAELYKQFLKEKRKVKFEEKKKQKREEEKMGDKAPPKKIPKTIENMRVPDETMIDPSNEEALISLQTDEMAPYFNQETTPKILITTSDRPRQVCPAVLVFSYTRFCPVTTPKILITTSDRTKKVCPAVLVFSYTRFSPETTPKILITTSDRPRQKTNNFCKELKKVIPNSFIKYRRGLDLKKIIPQAIAREFTDIIVINEDAGEPNGMLLCHLPEGPTAEFKLMNAKLCKELKRLGEMTEHVPEVNIHNFNTRLGLTIGRMLTCLFPTKPNYHGRRVVTFHNQRDYIFFRHHRYHFRNAESVGLQELGPRFILRLRSLQKGTFDSKYGMYIWVHKRHEMDANRRKFHL
ncbi:hypothetical protein BsWGS_20212 [Bradybaena similaris]